MKKLLQNKITGSRLTLPVTLCYAIGIWLLGGLIQEQWWIQFGCFMLTAYLMVQLNNTNALIRIYSRMVSVSFLLLSCMACFLFPSLSGNFTQLCIVASYLILFQSYHDKSGAGLTYYGFLCIGLASLTFVHILYFVPFLWILMLTCLQSFSLRTFFASLMGIITPYWLGICWLVYQDNFSLFVDHLTPLVEFQTPFDFSILNNSQTITFAFVILLALIGAIHYWRTYYLDKIRTRQLLIFFIWIDFLTVAFICLQPQYYDPLIRILIINTAPLIGHFMALAHTKITNIAFCLICITTLLLTGYNLWM
jgi:hypothetical protein